MVCVGYGTGLKNVRASPRRGLSKLLWRVAGRGPCTAAPHCETLLENGQSASYFWVCAVH